MAEATAQNAPLAQGAGSASDHADLEAAFYSDHDLRPTFTRDECSRRRSSGATLRSHLTDKQDKSVLNKMTKIRASHAVGNNDDIVIVWAQQMLADGKEEELAPALVEVAKATVVPVREAGAAGPPGHDGESW